MKDITGQNVPAVTFVTRKDGEFVNVTTDDIFKNKTVVVFSLPGAFTPTCSSTHLPRYNQLAKTFEANGVDEIVCLSVNDAFVMDAWAADQESDNVTLLPDGNGWFTDGMGMLVDKEDLGFGKRSWRYSMLVKNGVIEKMFIEPDVPGDPFEVSDADTMLNYIAPEAATPKNITLITKVGCSFCAAAKDMLNSKSMTFDEIVVGKCASEQSIQALSGSDTVPQVFVDGELIGGSEELKTYLS